MSCSLVESEIGCSCAGCACENPDTFEKNIRSFGRRTGNSTNSSTSAPTAAPTTADTTIVQAITTTFDSCMEYTTTFDSCIRRTTSDTYAAGTGGYKALCEAAYGVSLGIYTTTTNAWDTDCAVSSVAASSRRVDLTITYTATVSAAEASAATTAVSSLTAATLNTNAAAVNTAGTLTVTTVPTATTVATATASEAAGESDSVLLYIVVVAAGVVLLAVLIGAGCVLTRKKPAAPLQKSDSMDMPDVEMQPPAYL